jgi:hypothetical protein
MNKVYYTHKGKTYEIISEDVPPLRLLRDFEYCESIGDFITIRNRVIGGTTWGWLKEVEEYEVKNLKSKLWKKKEKGQI